MKKDISPSSQQGISKEDACGIIRHLVTGGSPPKEEVERYGGQVNFYVNMIRDTLTWSGLTLDETATAIQAAPDNIRQSDKQNFKPLFIEALNHIRQEQELLNK